MEFWIFLLSLIVLFLAFPYLRCFVKRLICFGKIRRLCRKKQYRLFGTHPLWFLGGKHSVRCDCYIETPSEVYAVKLFGLPRRLTVLILKDNGTYVIRSFMAWLPHVRFTFHSKPRRIPVYDFRYKYRDEWEIKTPHPILLIHPVSMEIRRAGQSGGEVIVGAGDTVNGMELESLSRFLGMLEDAV
ncbi:MAG: hypothetical protein IJW99_03265 [Clostridia bacterium]|nr:hypothetical protein [Clostridia bacterium]